MVSLPTYPLAEGRRSCLPGANTLVDEEQSIFHHYHGAAAKPHRRRRIHASARSRARRTRGAVDPRRHQGGAPRRTRHAGTRGGTSWVLCTKQRARFYSSYWHRLPFRVCMCFLVFHSLLPPLFCHPRLGSGFRSPHPSSVFSFGIVRGRGTRTSKWYLLLSR